MPCYAVAHGRVPGIYDTWDECSQQMLGFNGFRCKKFSSFGEAWDYIDDHRQPPSGNNTSSSDSYASNSSATSYEPPYYAVARGRRKGVYRTWMECKAQVHRFSSPRYMRFDNQAEADAYVKGDRSDLPLHRMFVNETRKRPDNVRLIKAYTDGSTTVSRNRNRKAGYGVYWAASNWPNDDLVDECGRVPGQPQTNNRGELMAILRAIQRCPDDEAWLCIFTDSMYCIHALCYWQANWCQNNWMRDNDEPVKNRDLIRRIKFEMLKRRYLPEIRYVESHTGNVANDRADKLAKKGARMPDQRHEEVEPPLSDDEEYEDNIHRDRKRRYR